jgi:hypothetical protein
MKLFDEAVETLAVRRGQAGSAHEALVIANINSMCESVRESGQARGLIEAMYGQFFRRPGGTAKLVTAEEVMRFGAACLATGAQIGIEMEK